VNTDESIDPVISNCPSIENLYQNSAGCNAKLPDYSGSITVNDCSSYTVTQSPNSGTTITQNTQVKLTVTDEYGNSSECKFFVVIEDVTAPEIISCVGDQNVNLDVNCSFTLPDYRNNRWLVISDCSDVTLVQTPEPGTVITDTTMVTITVRDRYTNRSACSFMVNTIDKIAPVINRCISDKTIELDERCTFNLTDYTKSSELDIL
jgi:hypothetical protein